jgi:hypothetical protein
VAVNTGMKARWSTGDSVGVRHVFGSHSGSEKRIRRFPPLVVLSTTLGSIELQPSNTNIGTNGEEQILCEIPSRLPQVR